MAYGLKVWDANGNVTLDVSDRITRHHGSYYYTITSPYTDVTVPGAVDDGTWFASTNGGHFAVVHGGYVRVRRFIAGVDNGILIVFRC